LERRKPRLHQGNVILQKFAEQYHGTYVNEQCDGDWVSMLALKL